MAEGQVVGFLKWRPQTAPSVGQKLTAKCTNFTPHSVGQNTEKIQNTGKQVKYRPRTEIPRDSGQESLQIWFWYVQYVVHSTAEDQQTGHTTAHKIPDKIQNSNYRTKHKTQITGQNTK